ncbi:MAG: D-alanyl-D-alanine carboxypeptidase/D-alanyl-D-alanine-endopeptidase [Succinivibrio sp.]|jgi:D-alanyl-D-alanine carboxypeptidase/D-alanyl-D-alanine-endopeptidase (penicillin-binding protein 4)|nr:D-alanyl-D-alanine carboxypeptidase/D-alanyl-D-alanine-endopeptidase [Succinivibrio sp.]
MYLNFHTLKNLAAAAAFTVSLQAFAIPSSPAPVDGINLGVAYRLPGSDTVYGQNYDVYMHPASTQKLLTALASYLYLGPGYRIHTSLQVKSGALGAQGALNLGPDGTLKGGILLRFSGDPTLTDKKYRELLNALKKAGVKRIDGPVILDYSRFSGRSRGQGWSWDDLPVCFTAPAAAFIINRNCAFAQLKTSGEGRIAEPMIPADTPVTIDSTATGVKASDYGGNCELEAELFKDNHYRITGCVPLQKNNVPWPLSLSVSDPDKWGRDWTEQALKRLGIAHGELSIAHEAQAGYSEFAALDSAPLSDLLRYMLYRSNNLYADAIAKNLAVEYFKQPATYYRATQAIRSVLLKYAKISLGNSYQVDGSGLSPHNLITPRQMLSVCDYIAKNEETLHFSQLLPVAGVSGTMHWRGSVNQPPLKGNVTAKTGSLTNTSNLAGFLTTKSGARVPFVIFSNNISLPQRQRDAVKYHRMASPTLGFERYVLEQIFNEKVMGMDF